MPEIQLPSKVQDYRTLPHRETAVVPLCAVQFPPEIITSTYLVLSNRTRADNQLFHEIK